MLFTTGLPRVPEHGLPNAQLPSEEEARSSDEGDPWKMNTPIDEPGMLGLVHVHHRPYNRGLYRSTTPEGVKKEMEAALVQWHSDCREATKREQERQRQRMEMIQRRERAWSPPSTPPPISVASQEAAFAIVLDAQRAGRHAEVALEDVEEGTIEDTMELAEQQVLPETTQEPTRVAAPPTPQTTPSSPSSPLLRGKARQTSSTRVTRSRAGLETQYFELDRQRQQQIIAEYMTNGGRSRSGATRKMKTDRIEKTARAGKHGTLVIKKRTSSGLKAARKHSNTVE